MTKSSMPLSELLEKHDDGDFLRAVAEAMLQLLMETDVEGVIGAGRQERSDGRTTDRNGYRDRALDTRVATLNLRVPKLRQVLLPRLSGAAQNLGEGPGRARHCLSEPWRDHVSLQDVRIGGVSSRRVDEPVLATGPSGMPKSTVSKLCKEIWLRAQNLNLRPSGYEPRPEENLFSIYFRWLRGKRLI